MSQKLFILYYNKKFVLPCITLDDEQATPEQAAVDYYLATAPWGNEGGIIEQVGSLLLGLLNPQQLN